MTKKKKTAEPWISGTDGLDTNLIIITVFLMIFGLMMIYSASYYKCSMSEAYNYDSMHLLKNQALMSLAGIAVMLFVSKINYHVWQQKIIVILAVVASVLLTLVLLTKYLPENMNFTMTANGATRWIKIGSVTFQVAEPVKIAVIMVTAYLISSFGQWEPTWEKFGLRYWFLSLFIIAPGIVLAAMLWKISDNLSTALIIGAICVVLYFAWHPKSIPFFVIALVVVIGVALYVNALAEEGPAPPGVEEKFRITRIKAWIDPYNYQEDESYQALQSMYAIGSGGLFGKGLGNSIQKLGKIPEAYNDFIFAIVCEELGILGASILILMFLYLLYRIFLIAQETEDLFGRMLVTGVFVHIAVQVVLNIAVVTSSMPNTGVTLPFISYGGTAVIFLLVEIGMVLNVRRWSIMKREEQREELDVNRNF